MPTRINQLNLEYDAVADRMLLSVSTSDREEFRVWITRRFLNALWPNLVEILEKDPAVERQREPVTRRAVLSLQHEQAITDTNFSRAYEAKTQEQAHSRPLGQEPLLASSARFARVNGNGAVLSFHSANGQGVELATNNQIIHSLCSLLSRLAERAEWDMDLDVGQGVVEDLMVSGAIN